MIQQTPWVQRTFNFDFPVGIFPVIFSRLEGTIFRLHSLLQSADDKQCSHSLNGWSVKQHIGHLYDLEDLWWQRLNDFNTNKAVLTAADINNKKTNEAGHNKKSIEELLSQFTIERQKILEAIYDFDAAILTKTSMHPRLNVEFRLVDSLYFVAEHDDHHLAKISELLRNSTHN
ncbi:MAG: DinB family protein [Chitinophagaceae bacterium]|nr:DinB family protein [Chitinophagaceae bacterium]